MLTPAKNYDFIVSCYQQASRERKAFEKSGNQKLNDTRLKGVTLEGASRTSKTWDTCIFICQYLAKYEGKQVTIARDTLANLKDTTYKTLRKVWELFGYDLNLFNKAATGFECFGNNVTFLGINDNIMKSHGHESDLLFVNEVMGVPKVIIDQLEQRCKEFFIYDFNPSAFNHWVFNYEHRPDVKNFKTTIFDNPYAPSNSVSKILSYAHPDSDDLHIAKSAGYTEAAWKKLKERNEALGTADLFAWQVYGLGQRAISEETIFPEFELYTDDPTEYDHKLYGLDFGYKEDPSALVQFIKIGHNIYLKELLYSTGYLNNDLAGFIKEGGYTDYLIVCDTAPAQNVDELRVLNVPATPCIKFPGSKAWGIQSFHQCKIHVHAESTNLIREMKGYRWAKDRLGEFKRNTLGQRIAVDKDDHAIQAAIYAGTYYLTPPESYEKV